VTAPAPATTAPHHHPSLLAAVQGQPRTVWVMAFATVIAFMGIGLVDPILLSIADGLHATPSQTTLLFSSYLAFQVLTMLATGTFAARFGAKRTVLVGLTIIVVFAGACAAANSIGLLIGLRAFWGMGNAFFIATALTVIVGAASGGQTAAILLYEAALGIGFSVGPLVGAGLGHLSWRAPFAGTAILMLVALGLSITQLPADEPSRAHVSMLAPLRALRHRRLFRVSLGSAFYTAAFFTVISWTPFVLGFSALATGAVFFGWGVCVAAASVILAPRIAGRYGERSTALGALFGYALLMVAFAFGSEPVVVAATVLSGICSGLLNTLFTGMAMSVSDAPRPIASAGYNFCRWLGGAVAATLVAHIADWLGSPRAPFVVAIVLSLLAAGSLGVGRGRRLPDPREVPEQAAVVGDAAVGAVDGGEPSRA
jgi:MFS family permease